MIRETDLLDPVSEELDEYPSILYPDAWDELVARWEYRQEVEECCGGRSWNCIHYGRG